MVAAKKNQKDSKGREGLARRASGLLSKPVTAVTTGALERALLAEFPAADAEPWDRTGMSVGDPARLITGVAVALDPTVEAIEAAANMGANVLVTHHPAFLAPPASFMPASSVAANPGAGVWRAVERGVSILSYHTALDVSVRAQRVLPGMLNLQFRSVEVPLASSKRKGYGQRWTTGSRWDSWPRAAPRCSAGRRAYGATSLASSTAWSPARGRPAIWAARVCGRRWTASCAARSSTMMRSSSPRRAWPSSISVMTPASCRSQPCWLLRWKTQEFPVIW